MIRLKVKIEEYEPGSVNIVKERVGAKVETEIETTLAEAIEGEIERRINELMAMGAKYGLRAYQTPWRRGAERVTKGRR
jgi:hypothetical protein